jgi:hypothetical protein
LDSQPATFFVNWCYTTEPKCAPGHAGSTKQPKLAGDSSSSLQLCKNEQEPSVKMPLTSSSKNCRLLLPLIIAIVFLTLPGIATAQDQDEDPPSRVARLNFIQGSVSFQPAGTQDWVEATPNRPLTTGDQLWVDQGSRGELHLGSTAIRVSEQTGLSFLNISDQAVQIQVAQGSADFRILHIYEGENYEIDTANQAFTIVSPGEYRVDVNSDGTQSLITVRNGAGEVTAGGQVYDVKGGQQYELDGTDQVNFSADDLPDPDDFDNWCVQRDRREDNAQSARYLSREVIGYEDLDDYGTWRTDPTYGPVWVPAQVEVGWAPYHTGHWAFVAPWGWTWVDDAPWGFAPFHYGRWAYVGGGWGWVPGPVAVVAIGGPGVAVGWGIRPVYAPALVGFVGGGGFSASIAIGGGVAGVAWVPLGPRDVWVPGYRTSAAYVTNVNVTSSRVIERTQITNVYNTTVINNRVTNITYTNQAAPGAVTAVPQAAFQGGRPVAAAAVKVSAAEISSPKVISAKPTPPTAQSYAGALKPAPASARPPASLASHPVVTKMAPSPRAIPVGHSQPLTAAAYKPATKPNAKPNSTVKPAARPASAGRPAAAPATRPAPNEAGARPANPNEPKPAAPPAPANRPPANAPAARPGNAAETRPATPPANRPENPPARDETKAPEERPAPAPAPAQHPAPAPAQHPAPAPAQHPAPAPAQHPAPAPKPAPAERPAPPPNKPAPSSTPPKNNKPEEKKPSKEEQKEKHPER